jgi:hypothetical protein
MFPEPLGEQLEPGVAVHVHAAPCNAGGIVSATLAPVTALGPAFPTAIVYAIGLPGIAVDRYGDYLVTQLFTGDCLFGVSWSPDSQRLAFGGTDKSVHVIAASDGKELMKFDNHSDWVFRTAWLPDGSG